MKRADGGVFLETFKTGVVFLAAPLPFLPLWLLLFRFGRRPRFGFSEKKHYWIHKEWEINVKPLICSDSCGITTGNSSFSGIDSSEESSFSEFDSSDESSISIRPSGVATFVKLNGAGILLASGEWIGVEGSINITKSSKAIKNSDYYIKPHQNLVLG